MVGNSRFTAEQDKLIAELYEELKNGKLPCWDAIVVIMNTRFPERMPRFTNDGIRSRYKRVKQKNKPKTVLEDTPPVAGLIRTWR
jgi:hypothetical protein